ncbi:hypothetical protein H6F43_03300 [Leptolyngbya sp. FACHB-36]|uniref:hypothetical protein n=1 Tax=Leptolyngbya sp. FACHB-36 TaxID=2692808 RepID=UPI0016813F61|nr:hypothetical protein [Leptolyngbya sp. FACHB-36]MBD2019210.1 hypothetical protein [Leptolyngbya sp. FACHB-36]
MKRSWYEIDWRKLAIISALLTAIACFPYVHAWLFPSPEVACVLERQNGEVVKAWNDACTAPDVQGVVLRLK